MSRAYRVGTLDGWLSNGGSSRRAAHAMRFTQEDQAWLKAFAEDGVLAPIGTGTPEGITPESGLSSGRGGFRTCDLSRVKRALSH